MLSKSTLQKNLNIKNVPKIPHDMLESEIIAQEAKKHFRALQGNR